MPIGEVVALISAGAALITSIFGPAGPTSLLGKAFTAVKRRFGGKQESQPGPAEEQSLAFAGLLFGALAFVFAGVAVVSGLCTSLSASGAPIVTLRAFAGVLSAIAMVSGLRGARSARANAPSSDLLNGAATAGVIGLLTGVGALAAMVII